MCCFVLATVYSNCCCLLVFREASDNLTVQNLKGSFSNASGIITNCNLNIIMLVFVCVHVCFKYLELWLTHCISNILLK